VELARHLIAPNGPYSKSQVARALDIARGSLYLQPRRAIKDEQLAALIVERHKQDNTLGQRRLAALLGIGHNRVARIMRKYGIRAQRKRRRTAPPDAAVSES
jgi:putative transposase